MVLRMAAKQGKTYESYGLGSYNKEQMRQELSGMWEPVWHVDLAKEVDDAITKLNKDNDN